MLSVKQVADIFQVTPQTIYIWVRKGILVVDFETPTIRRYFKEEQIERLMRGEKYDREN